MIRVRRLGKRFNGKRVVDGVDLAVEREEIVVVFGPSGCGKTTLLRLIAGLEQPDAGAIDINGRSARASDWRLRPHERGLSMIFQDLALWPHMSALENVLFGLEPGWRNRKHAREQALEALRWVGLDSHTKRHPHHLSGGERQRLAIARALAPGHPYLLMDEPFSNLDPLLKEDMVALVQRLRAEKDTTILYVTHNLDEALSLADRILMMNEGAIIGELGSEALSGMSQRSLLQWYKETLCAPSV
jgi:ABC-type Fe3+/spermidine/putrescine transport system ATPase subunit